MGHSLVGPGGGPVGPDGGEVGPLAGTPDLWIGGAADVACHVEMLGSGGVRFSGSGFAVHIAQTGDGGLLVGGTAVEPRGVVQVGSGGLLASGRAGQGQSSAAAGLHIELALLSTVEGWRLGVAGSSNLGESTVLGGAVSLTWIDVTRDTRATFGCMFRHGLADGKPRTSIASTGECRFWLDNSANNSAGLAGLYSPNHANCREGFRQNVPVRISFKVAGDPQPYYKFVGRLKDIQPLPGLNQSKYTACVGVDFFDDMARANLTGNPTYLNKKANELLSLLFGAMSTGPQSTQFDVGVSTFPWGMVGGTGGVINALQEAQRIVSSERGQLYMKGDRVSGGILRLENANSRPTNRTSLFALYDAMGNNPAGRTALAVPSSIEDVINEVHVTYHDRRVDGSIGSEVVLFSQPDLTPTSSALAPAATITINAGYRDPNQPATAKSGQVAGFNVLDPVSGVDYLANSAYDGSGTDLTANVLLVTTIGSTGATLEITNDGGTPMFITLLQVRGVGLYDYNALIAKSKDSASQDRYGTNVLELDCPYEASPVNAQNTSDRILAQWAQPFGFATVVSFIASSSTRFRLAAYAREIGDRITIVETQTGVSADFFINGIEMNVGEGDNITCTWVLTPASYGPIGWTLGEVGHSELGESTVLGV